MFIVIMTVIVLLMMMALMMVHNTSHTSIHRDEIRYTIDLLTVL